MQETWADYFHRIKYYSNEIMRSVIMYNNRIKISMIIVIAHAITLLAYTITAPLLPRGAIDHRGCASTVCGGSQPTNQAEPEFANLR